MGLLLGGVRAGDRAAIWTVCVGGAGKLPMNVELSDSVDLRSFLFRAGAMMNDVFTLSRALPRSTPEYQARRTMRSLL